MDISFLSTVELGVGKHRVSAGQRREGWVVAVEFYLAHGKTAIFGVGQEEYEHCLEEL